MCATLRHLILAQVSGSESSGCLENTWVLPVPAAAGAGIWEHCWLCPPWVSQQWRLTFQADPPSSRGIPGHASPHSHPFYCICAANCISLPRCVLPTPCFSPLTLPALADSRPRQGCPGLIPRMVLGWVALRALEPMQEEVTPAQEAGGPPQVGAPPNAHRGRRSWGVGKGFIRAALPLARCSTMTSCFGASSFFHRLSRLWCPLLLPLQAVFS